MKYPKTNLELKRDRSYYVYYLPEENYCGTTFNPPRRMAHHKAGLGYNAKKRNTDGWIILYHSFDKKECCYYESLFQSTLAMEGLDFKPDMWKK